MGQGLRQENGDKKKSRFEKQKEQTWGDMGPENEEVGLPIPANESHFVLPD